jgi:hypothetical protein
MLPTNQLAGMADNREPANSEVAVCDRCRAVERVGKSPRPEPRMIATAGSSPQRGE